MKGLKDLIGQQKKSIPKNQWQSRKELIDPAEDAKRDILAEQTRLKNEEEQKRKLQELAQLYARSKRKGEEPPSPQAKKAKTDSTEEAPSAVDGVSTELGADAAVPASTNEVEETLYEIPDIPKDLAPGRRIQCFIRKCLSRWKSELESRPAEEKASPLGKKASALYEVTRSDLKPLLRKIREGRLEVEVMDKINEVICFCIDKEYVRAHDKYIELAIGNAAWPMGVTMVGIHERVGRSKIASSEIAHILNDETTRKYIQMIKRLMSICQTWYPSDPSKMVHIATTSVLTNGS